MRSVVEPWGTEREDWRGARLAMYLALLATREDQRLEDHLPPSLRTPPEKAAMTEAEIEETTRVFLASVRAAAESGRLATVGPE